MLETQLIKSRDRLLRQAVSEILDGVAQGGGVGSLVLGNIDYMPAVVVGNFDKIIAVRTYSVLDRDNGAIAGGYPLQCSQTLPEEVDGGIDEHVDLILDHHKFRILQGTVVYRGSTGVVIGTPRQGKNNAGKRGQDRNENAQIETHTSSPFFVSSPRFGPAREPSDSEETP